MFISRQFLQEYYVFTRLIYQFSRTNYSRFSMDNSLKLFDSDQTRTLILLNSRFNHTLLSKLTKLCTKIICADGGANDLYENSKEITPNQIVGDFDSIKKNVLEYYKSKGVQIIHDENQDNTDFEKCLDLCQHGDVIVLGRFSGRLDQTLSMTSTLCKYQNEYPTRKFTIFGDSSILRVLNPGCHHIEINQEFEQNLGCALIPAGCKEASMRTIGFKWNLDFTNPLIFGKFISSSNELISTEIEIENRDDVLFITQLQDKLQDPYHKDES